MRGEGETPLRGDSLRKYYGTKPLTRFGSGNALYIPKAWEEFKPGDKVYVRIYHIDRPDEVFSTRKALLDVNGSCVLYCNKEWDFKVKDMVVFTITKAQDVDDDDTRVEAEE